MGIIYLISAIILLINFILVKKSEKEIDILGFICISIVLLFCYNTFVCYILTFFAIPCKLWILALINIIISLILGTMLLRKKQIQKYSFDKIDILYIILIAIVIIAIALINFGFPFEVNYASTDPTIHYIAPIIFAEQETLLANSEADQVYGKLTTFKPNSYVNSGLLMKCFFSKLDTLDCYEVFVFFGLFTLFLIGTTLYTALKKFAKKKEHIFWAFLIAVICTIGYPLNSFLFGFEYLTMGILVLCAILDLVYYYEYEVLNWGYLLIMFFLLNFGLFCSYYMFVPFTYAALWIYFCIKNYKKTKKVVTKKLIVLLTITLLIPFWLGFIYTLAPEIYSVLFENKEICTDTVMAVSSSILNSSFSTNGYIYMNLYSNILLLLPLPIYLFAKEARDKKTESNLFLSLIFLFNIWFIEILLIGNNIGKVSMYYLSKNYFTLWIILAFLNYKALIDIAESGYKYLSRLFIFAYILLMIICFIFSNVRVKESTTNEDENIFSVMEVFGANKTILKYKVSEFNQKELEIIDYANKNLDFDSRIEVVCDHRAYQWAYVLLRYTDKDKIFKDSGLNGQELLGEKWLNLENKIINENELDYVIYFNKSKIYKELKEELFKDSKIIYENESGGILKYTY